MFLCEAINVVVASALSRVCIDIDEVDVVTAKKVDELRWFVGVLMELEICVGEIKEEGAFRGIVESMIGKGISLKKLRLEVLCADEGGVLMRRICLAKCVKVLEICVDGDIWGRNKEKFVLEDVMWVVLYAKVATGDAV